MVEVTLQKLAPLIGEWIGRGKGGYPTLDGFDYAETLRVHHDPGDTYFTYEQRTELITPDGRPIRKSHWEAGVIRPMQDGSVQLTCVQSSGRVEILRGRFLQQESQAGNFSLRLQSEQIGNDGRVIRSSRDWRLSGDHFEYEMRMATTNVVDQTRHLMAILTKKGGERK